MFASLAPYEASSFEDGLTATFERQQPCGHLHADPSRRAFADAQLGRPLPKPNRTLTFSVACRHRRVESIDRKLGKNTPRDASLSFYLRGQNRCVARPVKGLRALDLERLPSCRVSRSVAQPRRPTMNIFVHGQVHARVPCENLRLHPRTYSLAFVRFHLRVRSEPL